MMRYLGSRATLLVVWRASLHSRSLQRAFPDGAAPKRGSAECGLDC